MEAEFAYAQQIFDRVISTIPARTAARQRQFERETASGFALADDPGHTFEGRALGRWLREAQNIHLMSERDQRTVRRGVAAAVDQAKDHMLGWL